MTDVVGRSSGSAGVAAASDALSRLVGVSAYNDQGARAQPTLQIRGFSLSPVVGVAQGISVFLDGVRINEPDAQELFFELIPFAVVERAELTRGASAGYGKNSLGGVLNLVTLRGDSPGVPEARVSIGSFGSLDMHVTAGGKRGAVDGLVMLSTSRENGYQVQSDATINQLFSTLGWRGASHDAALSLLVGGSRIYQAGSLPETWLRADRRGNYTGGDFARPAVVHVALRATKSGKGVELRGNVFARHNDIEQFNVNASDANSRAFITNASAGASGELGRTTRYRDLRLALAIGAEYTRSAVKYRLFAEPNAGSAVPDDCDAGGLCEDARVPGDDAALYGHADLQVNDHLAIMTSLRGDYVRTPFRDLRDASNNGMNIFRQLSPKIGVTYTPTTKLRAYGSFGLGFRSPAALELACASPEATCPLPFSLGADPPLEPVRAWTREVGIDWNPARGATLAIAAFHTDVLDEIVFVQAEAAAGYFQNISRTRRQGVESSLGVSLPGATSLRANYSYVSATYEGTTTLASALDANEVKPGASFPVSPRHRASVSVDLVRAIGAIPVAGGVTLRAVSAQYLRGDEANRTRPMSGFGVVDAHLQFERARFVLDMSAGNLLNRRYTSYGVYAPNTKGAPDGGSPLIERFFTPAYPRTITVGLSVR